MNNTAYLSENQVLNKRSYPSFVGKASIFSREMAVNRAFHDMSDDDIVESVHGLSPTDREIFSCFMEYHNLCSLVYVSQGRVGRRVGRCRRTVSRALGVFERRGLMSRTNRGVKKTCVYRVPEKVLKSFGLRERLKGLIPAFRFYSLVILASIYGVSDNNVPQVKHTVGSFYINKFNMYKKTAEKEKSDSNKPEKKNLKPKKEIFETFCGKKVRVKYVPLGREDKKWAKYVEFDERWLNESQQEVELAVYAQKMLKIRIKNSQEHLKKHDENIQKLKNETNEQKDNACSDLDELVKNNPRANMFAVYAKNGINNSRS